MTGAASRQPTYQSCFRKNKKKTCYLLTVIFLPPLCRGSKTTLERVLEATKDAIAPAKRDYVVYRIPCERGKVYNGETERSMQETTKEHDKDK